MPLKNVTKLCGANTRSGKPCENAAMSNGRCRMHSGGAPVGIASPHFKTGRYSKYLPNKLALKYDQAEADEKLISIRDEIGLVTALTEERLEKLYSGESEEMWLVLRTSFSSYIELLKEAGEMPEEEFPEFIEVEKSRSKKQKEKTPEEIEKEEEKNKERRAELLLSIQETIEKGLQIFSVYERVSPMFEQKRKLVESEAKRLKDLENNITAEKAFAIIALLSDVINRHVTDRATRASISAELAEAVNS